MLTFTRQRKIFQDFTQPMQLRQWMNFQLQEVKSWSMKVMEMAKLFRLLCPRICTLILPVIFYENRTTEQKCKDGKDVIYDRSSVCWWCLLNKQSCRNAQMQNAWHSLLHFPIDRVLKIRWWPFEGFFSRPVSSVMCINFKVETFVQKEKLNPCGMGASTLCVSELSDTSEDDARINY